MPHSDLLRLPPLEAPAPNHPGITHPPRIVTPEVETASRIPYPQHFLPLRERLSASYPSYQPKILPPLFHPGQPLQPPAQQQIQLGYSIPWAASVPGSAAGFVNSCPGELPFQASHPSQYVRGVVAYTLSAPAGTEEERQEMGEILASRYWLDLRHMLHREMQNRSVPEFTASGSDEYADWASSMVNFFQGAEISNTLVQTRLAALTLRHHARYWYQAHQQHTPSRLYSFRQFAEWIRIELVPEINPYHQHRAWDQLEYRGNLEDFFRDVDRLIRIYPIPLVQAQNRASKVFGKSMEERIDAAQANSPVTGLNMMQWQAVVKDYVRSMECMPGFSGWLRGDRGPRFRG